MKTCAVAGAVIALLFLVHCRPSDGCVPLSTRCDGNVAQLCDAEGSWQDTIDCDSVMGEGGAIFVCQFVSDTNSDGDVIGHTCVPAPAALTAGGAL